MQNELNKYFKGTLSFFSFTVRLRTAANVMISFRKCVSRVDICSIGKIIFKSIWYWFRGGSYTFVVMLEGNDDKKMLLTKFMRMIFVKLMVYYTKFKLYSLDVHIFFSLSKKIHFIKWHFLLCHSNIGDFPVELLQNNATRFKMSKRENFEF